MHNRLYVTLAAPADAGSEHIREDVFNRLMEDASFCGEGGRFGHPLCDWFVIGGRWSGLLADTLTAGEFTAKAKALPGMDAEFIRQSVVESHTGELDALWHSLRGTGPNPYSRNSYLQHGYADDAMPVSEALYKALLAEYEGIDSDGDHFSDLDFDEVNRGFIGRKWLVVVDYHS